MPEVELRGIGKRFGKVVASRNIDLKIADGEYLTILGPSGCGKTTLIRMIAGIIDPSEGSVLIGGRDMKGVPIEERDIGYVFQNIALFPHLNALGNVSYGPIVKDMDVRDIEEVPRRYLELVKLLDRMRFLWPGRWPQAQSSSCWTSPFPRWTPGSAWTCVMSSGGSPRTLGSPSFTSPMTRRRP